MPSEKLVTSAVDLLDLQGAAINTPMDKTSPQSDDHEKLSPQQRKVCRGFVGKVLYIAKGRPDLCFVAKARIAEAGEGPGEQGDSFSGNEEVGCESRRMCCN